MPDLSREGLLPPGLYDATLGEVRRRFGRSNTARLRLMKGLSAVVRMGRRAGALCLVLNGSFVTAKREPEDWDGVMVFPAGTDAASPETLALADRERMKDGYGADLFLVFENDRDLLDHFVSEVFGQDRRGRPKGLVRIRL